MKTVHVNHWTHGLRVIVFVEVPFVSLAHMRQGKYTCAHMIIPFNKCRMNIKEYDV